MGKKGPTNQSLLNELRPRDFIMDNGVNLAMRIEPTILRIQNKSITTRPTLEVNQDKD